MYTQNRNNIERHVKTHSQRSDEDRSAVTILETFLRANGKISTNFSKEDKWPNIDGTLEFVENPLITRRPKQNFFVQIKGTHLYTETDNGIKYSLKSLAFLTKLRNNYSEKSTRVGCHVIRYLLLNLREETIESVLPTQYGKQLRNDDNLVSGFATNESNGKSLEIVKAKLAVTQ